jgi:hypothetical protein
MPDALRASGAFFSPRMRVSSSCNPRPMGGESEFVRLHSAAQQ